MEPHFIIIERDHRDFVTKLCNLSYSVFRIKKGNIKWYIEFKYSSLSFHMER